MIEGNLKGERVDKRLRVHKLTIKISIDNSSLDHNNRNIDKNNMLGFTHTLRPTIIA